MIKFVNVANKGLFNKQAQALVAAPIASSNNGLFVAMQARSFAAKKKRTKKNAAGETTEEEEHVSEARSSGSSEELKLSRDLFQAFSVGNIKEVNSTPDHKAPSQEDTIEGRYASVLFMTASQNESLFHVFEDISYLAQLHQHSEQFRLFTENAGVGTKEIQQLNQALKETAEFNAVTFKFLEVLAENKRLVFIKEIADKYKQLYQEFNREEKIKIISATELSHAQREEVLSALKANPQNSGKEFTIEYEVDNTIVGGLQMYTQSEFMDMSLQSRVERINQEVAKFVN